MTAMVATCRYCLEPIHMPDGQTWWIDWLGWIGCGSTQGPHQPIPRTIHDET